MSTTVSSTTKKRRQRRSIFGIWMPNKSAPLTSKCEQSPADSTGSDSSPASDPIPSGLGKHRLRLRLARSGSRILILFGLAGSSNSKTSVESGSYGNSHSCERDQSPLDEPASHNGMDRATRVSSLGLLPGDAPLNAQSDTIEALHATTRNSLATSSDIEAGPGTEQNVGGDEGHRNPHIVANVPLNPVNSRLVDRFSQRLSFAFGHPTVIRRAHLRSRPSILLIDSPVSISSCRQGDGANDSSDPSTTPSSSASPAGYSTPPTPLTSAEPSPSSDKEKEILTDFPHAPHSISETNQSPSSKSPAIKPSILTVEATSVAKIYLELYFNSKLQSLDPRLQRQHEVDQYIFALGLNAEEQLATRRSWLLQETEYLRQCRVLTSAMRRTHDVDAATTAGYEVIKVLGKGSFGVVRLVREKGTSSKTIGIEEPTLQETSAPNARISPIDIVRSAVDGTKHSRRRFMNGEKKEVYAMKVIKKSNMIRNSQEGHIRAERDFLVASERSRWIVPLITSFQDSNYLYLVMDYMVGGDFLGLLIRKDILREDWARFYIAEMIACIEEAHRLCWIHRDIKPDNFLISASGHLKISDFGLAFNGHWSHDQVYYRNQRYSLLDKLDITIAGDTEDQANAAEAKKELMQDADSKRLDDCLGYNVPSTDLLNWRNSRERRRFAKSVVGTSQYMAPEVIRGEMYDGRCDWWSLGIILYECLYGCTPFACETRHDTKIRILHHSRTLRFPRDRPSDRMVSREAIDLINRILQEREFRLCSPRYQANDILVGRPVSSQFLYSMDPRYKDAVSYYVYPNDAVDIKAHPFFRGIRWNELHLMQPPLIPRVKNWEDTRYFDDWKSLDNAEELSDASDQESIEEELGAKPASIAADEHITPVSNAVFPLQPNPASPATVEAKPEPRELQEAEKQKEKQRPRDKILRDKNVGRTALEIRKKGAFLGYTYRRPKRACLALSTERGRRPFLSSQSELYAF